MTEIAQLMPNGEQTFVDANGVPLAGGTVGMYVPNTGNSVFKNTWQDQGESVLNANPIVLDSAGRCIIYGNGQYQQLVKDQFGAIVWNQLTNWVNVLNTYDLAFQIEDKPGSGENYPVWNAPRPLTLPAGLTNSQFTIDTAPTGNLTGNLTKVGTGIVGSVTFAAGTGALTISFAAPVSFAKGQQLRVVWPVSQDGTGAGIAGTLVFTS